MLHLLIESGDGNSELKGKRFPLGKNIYAHLKETLDNYKGDKSVEGYKRLVNIINMNDNEGGILYNEMKRIKNFFDNYNGSRDSVNYILNGGEPMENWVRNTLNTAIETVKGFKQAKAMGGLNNSFRKEHTKDRIVKPPKETKIKMSDINKNLLNVAGSGFKITKPNKIKSSVNEVKTLDEIWEDGECTPYNILSEFKYEHQGKNDTINWKPLIKPQQYQNALRNYMQYGDAMRFPERYIDEWLEIIARNLVKLNSCTELAGHSAYWPNEDFDDVYGEEYDEWYEENKDDLPNSVINLDKDDEGVKFEFLETIGFFDYLKLPDGSDAWSDYGIEPIGKILREYRDDMTPGEKLVLINRCLDVGHYRGDLASAFIEGGNESCAQISNGGYQGVNECKTSKRTFYITEEQQRRVLNEITIKNKFEKEQGKTKWQNPRDFQRICQSDPTYNREKDIVGKYTNWLLLRLNDLSDLERVKVPLEWYADGMKRGILQRQGISPDINTYKSVDDFINAMQTVIKSGDEPMQSASEMNNREKFAGQFKVIGQSRYWEVISPLTFEAERWFGRETKWCTVANEDYFEEYSGSNGELFIFYPKNGELETRIQVHFDSESYFDVYDNGYDNITQALASHNTNEASIEDGVNLANKLWNLDLYFIKFNEVPELLAQGVSPEEIFDEIGESDDGYYSLVRLNGKYNILIYNKRLISPLWFNNISSSDYDDYFVVCLNHKYNFMNSSGRIIYKPDDIGQWFDYAYLFWNYDFARVKLNDKWNFIKRNGNILYKPNEPNKWFNHVETFIDDEFARVELKGNKYLLRKDGVLCDTYTKEPIPELNESKVNRRTFRITEEQISTLNKLDENDICHLNQEQIEALRDCNVNYNKYQYLLRKPINKLSLDEMIYLYSMHFIKKDPYNDLCGYYEWNFEKYLERIKKCYLKEFTAAYDYFSKLKFPIKIYRAMYSSENIDNISGKKYSLSWTVDPKIYSDEKSKFKNCNRIVEAIITPDMVQNEWTIVNFITYTAKHFIDPNNNNYGEYELTLKPRFKHEMLSNLKQFNKMNEEIIKKT